MKITRVRVGDGNDSIVVIRDLGDLSGGRTLDMSGWTGKDVRAGHIIIKKANGDYAPLGVDSMAYVDLSTGEEYAGVLKKSVTKKDPRAAIMTRGIVNYKALPYEIDDTIAAGLKDILFMGYIPENEPGPTPVGDPAYGVRHDRTSDSPTLERIGNLDLHATLPVQSKMRRCLLLDNGNVNYYLDPDDSTKKADGTAADLTGADGMYMVEIPEHWRKYVSVEPSAPADDGDNYEEFWLSESALDGWEHVPVTYVSVDEACMDRTNKKLAAVVNNTAQFRGGDNTDTNDSDQYLTLLQRPASSLSWQDFYGYANNRGSGWTNYLLYNNTIIYWLYMVEYATTNSQATYDNTLTAEGYRKGGLGNDATDFFAWFDSAIGGNPFIPTGITNSLGNHTGIVDYTLPGTVTGGDPYTAHISSYRGIALPFGHLTKAASGVFVTSPDGSVVNLYTCNDPNLIAFEITSAYQSVRCGEPINGAGIKKLGYHNGNLYPVEGFDTSELQPSDPLTSWFCDFAYINGGTTDSGEAWDGVSVPSLGGHADGGSYCGFAFAFFGSGPAGSYPDFGSRLCFIPTTSAWSGGSYDPD